MTRHGFDPLADAHLFVSKIRDAADDARDALNAINGAYKDISGGGRSWSSDRPTARVLRSIDTALRMDFAEGQHACGVWLAEARAEASRLNRILERSYGNNAVAGVQLDLFRAQYAARELVRLLDDTASRAGRLSSMPAHPQRSRDLEDAKRSHKAAVEAFNLQLLEGSRPKVIEITLPGMLLGIAVICLPARHRSRYREEFKAEVHDLPDEEQVAYAARQCLFALTLRQGLIKPFWRSRSNGPDPRAPTVSGASK